MNREEIVSLEDGGRKVTFGIRKMPALRMEAWLTRAAEVLPPELARPVAGSPTALAELILRRGLLALACGGGDGARRLLDELMACCMLKDPESGLDVPCTPAVIDEWLGNVRTLLRLRQAALLVNLSFAMDGARKTLVLPREAAFRRAAAEQTQARTVNVPQVCAALISQGIASLNDLRNIYSYTDALDLLEVLNVRNYNLWAAAEEARRKRR